MPQVRLVDEDGAQIGIKSTSEALEYAYSKGLDLVEVAAQADPPVARVMDYGKYRYEQEQKAKLARKHQTQINVKEIKLRPKIGVHDYETKKGLVTKFLGGGHRVKVTVMFRGREMHHTELGARILDKLAVDLDGVGAVEVASKLDGRNMTMMFAPVKKKPEKAEKAPVEGNSNAEDEEQQVREEAVQEDG